jgi:hypothetical protein
LLPFVALLQRVVLRLPPSPLLLAWLLLVSRSLAASAAGLLLPDGLVLVLLGCGDGPCERTGADGSQPKASCSLRKRDEVLLVLLLPTDFGSYCPSSEL